MLASQRLETARRGRPLTPRPPTATPGPAAGLHRRQHQQTALSADSASVTVRRAVHPGFAAEPTSHLRARFVDAPPLGCHTSHARHVACVAAFLPVLLEILGGTAMSTTASHARHTKSSRRVVSGVALVGLVGYLLSFGAASAQAQSNAPQVSQPARHDHRGRDRSSRAGMWPT